MMLDGLLPYWLWRCSISCGQNVLLTLPEFLQTLHYSSCFHARLFVVILFSVRFGDQWLGALGIIGWGPRARDLSHQVNLLI